MDRLETEKRPGLVLFDSLLWTDMYFLSVSILGLSLSEAEQSEKDDRPTENRR